MIYCSIDSLLSRLMVYFEEFYYFFHPVNPCKLSSDLSCYGVIYAFLKILVLETFCFVLFNYHSIISARSMYDDASIKNLLLASTTLDVMYFELIHNSSLFCAFGHGELLPKVISFQINFCRMFFYLLLESQLLLEKKIFLNISVHNATLFIAFFESFCHYWHLCWRVSTRENLLLYPLKFRVTL